jgi:hypothetical protein
MKLGIVKEIRPDERRVAAAPSTVGKWVKAGWEVVVEAGAGAGASFPDDLYRAAGATVLDTAAAVWSQADVVCKVRPPSERADGTHEADSVREGQVLISFIYPAQNKELVDRLAARKATVLAMDCIPRISRAQKVDALSSMANISGYRAVVEAAQKLRLVLHRPDHRRRQGAAGQGAGHRRRRRRPGRARRRQGPGRDRPRLRRARRRRRPGEVDGRGVPDGDHRRVRRGPGRLRQGDEQGVHRRRDGAVPQAGRRGEHRHHHRAHPRPAGAQAVAEGHGRGHEAGLGGGRPGRRGRRQLRPDQAGRGRRARRRHRHRLHRPAEPHGQRVERAVRHQPVAPARRAGRRGQVEGRSRQRHRPRRAGARRRRADVAAAQAGRAAPGAPRPPPAPPVKPRRSRATATATAPRRPSRCRPRSCSAAGDVRRRVPRHALRHVADRRVAVDLRAGAAPHGVRAGGVRRLAGGVERHPGPAHPADERHQRGQRHHRHRRPARTGSGELTTASAVAIAAVLFATINIAGGFWVTRRMLAMFRK